MQLFGFLIVASVILNFGSCDKECPFDSGGPNCQFKNIAYNKESRHDSNTIPIHYSSEANDDNLATCSTTSDENTAAPWWNVWLSKYTTFKKLEFVTVDSHRSHFRDFEITVYNTTESNFKSKGSVSGGQVCYTHNNSIPQSTKLYVTCNGSPVGNLIRLQLHSATLQLILCDFRLYGDCYNGFYGNECQKCSDNCQSSRHRYCDSKNGHCFQGCKPGWKGDRCDTICENRMWGENCRRRCGKCDSSVCDHITGECPRGCSAGFKPPYCSTVCDSGFFGKKCQNRCNDNCLPSQRKALCDNVNGTCLNGCKTGYQGSQCSNKCETGKWGQDCRGICGNCDSSACDHITGECQRGCSAGFKPPYCDTECETGKWGQDCRGICGNCDSSACDHITGECQRGCSAGYKPPYCTTVCDSEYYGQNCSRPCSSTCERSRSLYICNNVNGTCLSGCIAGYEGSFCEKECDDDKWGSNCRFECGKCYKSVCNRANGVCKQGCASGFKSRRCTEKCDNGSYGKDCQNECNSNCLRSGVNAICDNVDGTCLNGCKAGYRGSRCDRICDNGFFGKQCLNRCNNNCLPSRRKALCNNENGTCLNGCKAGYQGSQCSNICDSGYYGQNCSRPCSSKCEGSRSLYICNNVNGTCLSGCKAGYEGSFCEKECDDGKWGSNCIYDCGKCDKSVCNRADGVCEQGCAPGFKTQRCTKKCDNGSYGKDCQNECNSNCLRSRVNAICDNVDGTCLNGCKAGYRGSRCDRICDNGFFGKQCLNRCNNNCLPSRRKALCNNENGTCLNGCKAGYQGSQCSNICDSGYYGKNCSRPCSSKCEGSRSLNICNNVNGTCLSGCKAGYEGSFCEKECDNAKWGSNCIYDCGKCDKSVCNRADGVCEQGCAPGFKTQRCTEKCDNGSYGKDCQNECNSNCLRSGVNAICDNVDGTCLNGCKAGYRGSRCDIKCDDGKWGKNCTNDCGKCLTLPCNHVNGYCKNGCAVGYKKTRDCHRECDIGTYGKECKSQCSNNCVDVCDKKTGMCSDCKTGWKGERCTKECNPGKWGTQCRDVCGKCVREEPCDRFNGTCVHGCLPGFKMTLTCKEVCEDGTYGNSCLFNCSQTCEGICNKMNGTCYQCRQGWSGDFCDEALIEDFSPFTDDTSATSGIIGGLTVVVILVLLIVLAVFIYRRKQKTERRNNESKTVNETNRDIKDDRANVKLDEPSNSVSYVNASYVNASDVVHKMRENNAVSNDKGNGKSTFIEERKVEVEYSIPKTAQGVLLSEFETYVRSGLANTEIFFQQFQQIPYGMQYASDVATKPKNHCKNRYKAMYAYDHSRVILRTLPDQPGSDYINASKIMGNTGNVSYIAAQGPISSTLGDFWRMIWEQTVRTIVMLTNLTEEGKMKCLKYWPEAGEFVEHGNIVVLSELEDVFAEFTIRRLKIHQKNKPDRARTLAHFHFTAWPDKDVPRSTSCLLHFWHQVRNHDEKKARPWLVHCSAGVGRTGTFIGLDVLCDMGKDYGFVDVFKCVDDLRKQRVNMVQTKNQYKYLHCAVLEALVLPSEPAHMDNFHAIYNHLKMTDPEAGKTSLLMQYETLTNDCEVITSVEDPNEDKYAVAKRDENKNKNRFDDILAPGECRPFLLTKVPGCTDYINAIFIPGYRDKFGYILTQTPLQSTAIDCCRLVYEQEIKVIVTFQEYSKKDVGIYLPNEGTANFGPFTMKFLSEKELTYYTKRNYKLLYKSETHAVSQLIYKHWPPSRMTPPDPTKMLNFLENLDTLRRQNDCKPILVQCFNGAERSGLVVALMNILEQLKFNKEVSIPLVVRQLKCRRQQIIPSFEQFTFCYDVVLSHIESHTTYANM